MPASAAFNVYSRTQPFIPEVFARVDREINTWEEALEAYPIFRERGRFQMWSGGRWCLVRVGSIDEGYTFLMLLEGQGPKHRHGGEPDQIGEIIEATYHGCLYDVLDNGKTVTLLAGHKPVTHRAGTIHQPAAWHPTVDRPIWIGVFTQDYGSEIVP